MKINRGNNTMCLPARNEPQVAVAPGFQQGLVNLIPFLQAFARTLCRHRDLAEDMAQNALTKAWRSRDQFQQGTNLKAWLFAILRNEYYSHRRRAWREMHWDEVKGESIAAAPDSQLWSLQLSDTTNALHALPDGQREALILVGAGGFSYDEAARICKRPAGTVKSRVGRGRAALTKMLDDDQRRRSPRVCGSNDIQAQLSTLMALGAQAM